MNTIYKIIFFVGLILITKLGFPQMYIGVKHGVVLNAISRYYDAENYKAYPSIGYSTGVIIKYIAENNQLGIITGLNLVQKNYKLENLNYTKIYQKNVNSFLDLPIKIQCNFKSKNYTGYLNCGMVISRWLYSKVNQTLPDIYNTTLNSDGSENIPLRELTTRYDFDKENDNRIQAGVEASLGLECKVFKRQVVFFGVSHQRTFTNYSKVNSNAFPKRNIGFNFDIGLFLPVRSKEVKVR